MLPSFTLCGTRFLCFIAGWRIRPLARRCCGWFFFWKGQTILESNQLVYLSSRQLSRSINKSNEAPFGALVVGWQNSVREEDNSRDRMTF